MRLIAIAGLVASTALSVTATHSHRARGECWSANSCGKPDRPSCIRMVSEFPPYGSDAYISYDCLVCLNRDQMAAPNYQVGNSERETQDVVNVIKEVSAEAGIPPEIAFAIAMQESTGSVRPRSGDGGKSRGLFQVQKQNIVTKQDEGATCFNTEVGTCPIDTIKAMVRQGICGYATETGITDCSKDGLRWPGIALFWKTHKGNIGLVSRWYNSGSAGSQTNLTDLTNAGGTSSYASDIANRMMGRVSLQSFSGATC